MPKTASVYTRVEPEIKAQAEQVLSKLGIPMANAINLFLHQIALQRGIPFDIKLPQIMPLDYSMLSQEQFNNEMEKGLADLNAGRTKPSQQVRENIQRKYRA
jgi:DNA-damage-inducible protein J